MNALAKLNPVEFKGKTVCLVNKGNQWFIGQSDRDRTSPQWEKLYENRQQVKYTRHAEAHALQLANRVGGKIKKMIVIRFKRNGSIGIAKPCIHCQKMLADSGVPFGIVHYTDEKGEMQCLGNG